MTTDIRDLDLDAIAATPEGTEIPLDALLPDSASRFFLIFDIRIDPSLAIIIVAAICFFLGVLTALVTAKNKKDSRTQIVASSPMVFLLSAIIWFPLLNGELIETTIAPIDAVFKFLQGKGELPNQMFMLGLVMLLGVMSLPIYRLAQRTMQFALNLVGKKVAPPPANPPAE